MITITKDIKIILCPFKYALEGSGYNITRPYVYRKKIDAFVEWVGK